MRPGTVTQNDIQRRDFRFRVGVRLKERIQSELQSGNILPLLTGQIYFRAQGQTAGNSLFSQPGIFLRKLCGILHRIREFPG